MAKTRGKYPDAFYRVSIKAIIRNQQQEVLVVKEGNNVWSLPGGGMDHGETPEQVLAREMYEEVLIQAPFEARFAGTDSMFLVSRDAYLLWIVYELTFAFVPRFGVGKDGNGAAFIDPKTFKNSPNRAERLVYRWCVDRTAGFE